MVVVIPIVMIMVMVVVMAHSEKQGSFKMLSPTGVINPLAMLGTPPLSPTRTVLVGQFT